LVCVVRASGSVGNAAIALELVLECREKSLAVVITSGQ
jgi:hypothetical protein